MKSRTWMWTTVVYLFAALAMPVGIAAQDNPSQDHKPKHQKYRLYDVGTFGGATSFGPGVGNGGPIINGRGALVGTADTTVPFPPNSNGFVCFPGPNVNHAFRWQDGHTVDLGSLPPSDQNCSIAAAINDMGEIAGESENGIIDPILGLIEMRAADWMNGRVTDLGTFGGNQGGLCQEDEKSSCCTKDGGGPSGAAL